jgi:subtilisin family serine protease
MRLLKNLSVLLAVLFIHIRVASPVAAQTTQTFRIESVQGRDAVAGEILVRFRDGVGVQAQTLTTQDADIFSAETSGRTGAIRLRSRSRSVAALLQSYGSRMDVLYAEPNYVMRSDDVPNDALFGQQWAMRNTGQSVAGIPGIAGADIQAAQAWDITEGSRNIVVGVVDSGVDYTHPDLAANIWSAPAAFTVNIGGQLIHCAAGTHGFNAINKTCDPMDDRGHGTHVSGILAGTGNNGNGVTGVSRVGSIMGLKFLSASGSGSVWDAIAAIEFAIQVKALFPAGANIRVLNNSWGGSNSIALRDAISQTVAADMLFVASAGNFSVTNDLVGHYPSNFDFPNILAVAATDNNDLMASFSSWGSTSVHLGAPGVDVMSTLLAGTYGPESGSSMSTAMVSGSAALLLSACTLTTSQLRATLLGNVDALPALSGKTTSGGRLNVYKALTACAGAPQPQFRLSITPGSQTTEVNGTVNLTVTVTSVSGFAGTVNLAAPVLPAGITASFTATSVTGGSGTSTLSLTASAAAQAGTATIAVIGTSGPQTSVSSVALTVGATINPGQAISGTLTTSDRTSSQDGESYADFYRLTLTSSTPVTIDLKSQVFDPKLYLLSTTGLVLYSNDDDVGDDSRIQATLPAGTYSIEATSALPGVLGRYALTINSPTLTGIMPPVGEPGGSVSVTLTGTRLTVPLAIDAGPGIAISGVSISSPTQVTATFAIAANASTVPREITVTTFEGTSNPVTFTVPPPIAVGQRISGTLATTDQISPTASYHYADLYRLVLTATTRVWINMSTTSFTPDLAVLSSAGLEISPQGTSLNTNATSYLKTLTPGTYYIVASSRNGFGPNAQPGERSTGDYDLSINLPSLNTMNRRFWGAGSSTTVTMTGINFVAPMTVDAGPGVTVTDVSITNNPLGGTLATALFTISGDATPGIRNVTVTTPAGVSNALTFRVYPAIPVIVPRQTVTGALANTDVASPELPNSYADFYQLNLSSTTLLTINLQASAFDGLFYVLQPTGSPIPFHPPFGVGGANPRLTASLAAGTYFVEVTSANAGGTGAYSLTAGDVVITSVSPRFAAPGTSVNVSIAGSRLTLPLTIDAGNDIAVSNVNVLSPALATATLTIAAGAPAGYRNLTVTTAEGASNTLGFLVFPTIAPLLLGQPVNGALTTTDPPSAVSGSVYADMYRLDLANLSTIEFELNSASFNSFLHIFTGTGALLTTDDDSGGQNNARIRTTIGPGTYFVHATSRVSGLGDYTLTARVQPTLASLEPSVGYPGAVRGLTLTGTGFIAPMTVTADSGITVSNVEVLSSTSAIATIVVAPNAPRGPRFISVTTSQGTSIEVSSFNVTDAPASQLFFPRLVSPGDLAGTGLAITNPSSTNASVSFTLYNPSGAVLNTVAVTVPARAQYVKLGNEIFPTGSESGWIKATSDSPGLQAFWLGGNFSTFMDGAAAATPARQLVFPLSTSRTEVHIANTVATSNPVTFRIYGSAGTELAAAVTQTISGNGIYTASAASLFPSVDFDANTVSIRAAGTLDIVGASVTTGFPIGPSWTVVNGVDASLSLFELNFAHVPTGPDNGWLSVLGITNLSPNAQNLTITFTPVSGSPVQVMRNIAAGATLRESAHTLFNFSPAYQEGWVRVAGTGALTGFIAYGFTGGNASAVVPGQGIAQSNLIFSHVAMGPGWGTGLALLNATSTPANVEVYIMRKDGSLVGGAANVPTASFILPAGTKTAKLLEELVPAANANDGFVYVRTTNNVPLYGLELFFTRDVQVIANVAAGVVDPSITYTPPAP